MLETDQDTEESKTERLSASERVHRLLDMLVQEVSLVDRAANKRKLLVRKGTGDMDNDQGIMDTEAAAEELETEELIEEEISEDAEVDKGKGEDEEDEEEQEDEEKGKQSLVLSPGAKAGAKSMLEAVIRMVASCVAWMKNVPEVEGHKSLPANLSMKLQAVAASLRGIGSKYAAKKGDDDLFEDATIEKVDAAVKAKVIEILGKVAERVAALSEMVSGAEETENAAEAMPQPMADEANAIAELIEGIVSEYKSTKKAMSPAQLLQEATNVVNSVMSKLGPGKPCDEDSYQKLDRLRAVLLAASKDTGNKDEDNKEEEEDEAKKAGKAVWSTAYVNDLPDENFLYVEPGGEKDEDGKTVPRTLRHWPVRDDKGELDLAHVRNALARIPQTDVPQAVKDKAIADAKKLLEELKEGEEKVAKAGAKMSRARRKKFEDAIKVLIGLFKEVMPEKDLGKMPHLVTKREEPKEDPRVAELTADVEKRDEELAKAREEIARLKATPVDSNVANVETTVVKTSNGSEKVSWPMDLNAED